MVLKGSWNFPLVADCRGSFSGLGKSLGLSLTALVAEGIPWYYDVAGTFPLLPVTYDLSVVHVLKSPCKFRL